MNPDYSRRIVVGDPFYTKVYALLQRDEEIDARSLNMDKLKVMIQAATKIKVPNPGEDPDSDVYAKKIANYLKGELIKLGGGVTSSNWEALLEASRDALRRTSYGGRKRRKSHKRKTSKRKSRKHRRK